MAMGRFFGWLLLAAVASVVFGSGDSPCNARGANKTVLVSAGIDEVIISNPFGGIYVEFEDVSEAEGSAWSFQIALHTSSALDYSVEEDDANPQKLLVNIWEPSPWLSGSRVRALPGSAAVAVVAAQRLDLRPQTLVVAALAAGLVLGPLSAEASVDCSKRLDLFVTLPRAGRNYFAPSDQIEGGILLRRTCIDADLPPAWERGGVYSCNTGALENIRIKGLKYATAIPSKNATQLARFRASLYETPEWRSGVNPNNAKTTSGGALVFESNSRKVTLSFVYDKDDGAINSNSNFAVMQNGQLQREFYTAKTASRFDMIIWSQSPDENVQYEVILPSLSNPLFAGVVEGDLHSFDALQSSVYVALGDSITHGVGQASKTFQTYAWQVATDLGAELFNLAVSGGKVSNQVAEQLVDWPRIDVITSLVGYNDWYYAGKSMETYIADYREMLATVRRTHPTTPVFVLNCLYTTSSTSPRTGIPLEDFRVGLRAMVADLQSQGDADMYLVPSDTWMEAADLADVVHLNPGGAAKMASLLSQHIAAKVNV